MILQVSFLFQKRQDFFPSSYGGRNLHFGIREFAMGAVPRAEWIIFVVYDLYVWNENTMPGTPKNYFF